MEGKVGKNHSGRQLHPRAQVAACGACGLLLQGWSQVLAMALGSWKPFKAPERALTLPLTPRDDASSFASRAARA